MVKLILKNFDLFFYLTSAQKAVNLPALFFTWPFALRGGQVVTLNNIRKEFFRNGYDG